MHMLQEIIRESVVFSIPMGPNLVTIDVVDPERAALPTRQLGAVTVECQSGFARQSCRSCTDEIEDYIPCRSR